MIAYMYSLLRDIPIEHSAADLSVREANLQHLRLRLYPLQPTLVAYR